jgi:GTP cyclohydrolase I
MCFVSKEMVPINETVEVQYMPGKKVRVLPKYIRYETDEGEEATA